MRLTECRDCRQGMLVATTTGRCATCQRRAVSEHVHEPQAIKITCSFCGRQDWPSRIADHWCTGRLGFITRHGQEANR